MNARLPTDHVAPAALADLAGAARRLIRGDLLAAARARVRCRASDILETVMTLRDLAAAAGLCGILSGCAQPIGPTVQVLPPPGKSFAEFQADQRVCSMYTNDQVKPLLDRAGMASLGSAALGTVLGAGLGAAIGGGNGAAIGAAGGAIVGTGAGADQSATGQDRIQVIYDNTYAGCMVAHGDKLPAAPVQQVIVTPPAVYVQPAPYVIQTAPPAQP